MIPDPTLIYHITHIDNLRLILETRRLLCHDRLSQTGKHPVNIAHQGIQARRAATLVPRGPGGTLHQYIPFYFAPRSPMLYALHRGYVVGYQGGQTSILHLVSSVQEMQESAHQFVFTDGHATMAFTNFYTESTDLKHVDWRLMKETYWQDTVDDPDRKRRRQAEFLVYNEVKWDAIIGIGVHNQQILTQTQAILNEFEQTSSVRVRRKWYY